MLASCRDQKYKPKFLNRFVVIKTILIQVKSRIFWTTNFLQGKKSRSFSCECSYKWIIHITKSYLLRKELTIKRFSDLNHFCNFLRFIKNFILNSNETTLSPVETLLQKAKSNIRKTNVSFIVYRLAAQINSVTLPSFGYYFFTFWAENSIKF